MAKQRGPSDPLEARPPRENRIRRHLRLAAEVGREPQKAYPLLRGMFVAAWGSRGGGFYGLGYVVAFVYAEIGMFVSEALNSSNLGDFALGQLLEYVLRLGLLSFVNVFKALLWPFFVLEWLGGVGIVLLAAGFFGFEYAVKPLVERHFPELRASPSVHPDR